MPAAPDQEPRRQNGAAVERLRLERGLSQRELALKVGIGQPSLCRIISGHRNARMVTLNMLAHALDVPVTELLSDTAVKAAA